MKKYRTACAIILNNKGNILLIKRGREPYKGYWSLISGIGESKKGIPTKLGIIEEVNCDLRTNSFKGKYIFSLPVCNDKFTDQIDVFLGKVNEKEIRMHPGFTTDYKWVSKKDTKIFNNLAFEHSRIIKDFLKRESEFK